ncbi:MAG: AEC family transporter, partial [Aestuariivirgaceae bacterium]
MSAVFASLLPVFLLIALGFALKHWRVVPEDLWRGIELLGYWAFLPSLIILTMIKADLRAIDVSAVSLTMVAVFVSMSVLLITTRRPLSHVLDMTPAAFTSLYQSSVRWNSFIALPIAIELYGETGAATVAIIMAWLVPLSNGTAVAVLARFAAGDEQPGAGRIFYIVFRNPFIWATFAGMAINLMGLALYQPILATLDLLGGAAIASGLLMVGAGLRLRDTLPPNRAAIAGTATKLIGMPLLVLAWSSVFGLSGTTFTVAIICAAVPTAMNGYLLARQMGGDAPLQAATTTLQIIISFVSIPA